jgi:PPOX class probable F420-dependent enzyme
MTTQSAETGTARKHTIQELRAIAADFLKQRHEGIFATTQRNGSPQQTMIGYRFNGEEIIINVDAGTAKAKNARRNSKVSLAVSDGSTCVVVYGTAKVIKASDPESAIYQRQVSTRHSGERVFIVFAPETYRWAKLFDEPSPSLIS